jgi:hypothetical protein
MAENCMFCLDEVKQNEEILNPIGCQCVFKAHGPCLHAWFEEKNQYECPICHTVAAMNPTQGIVQVIYVNHPFPPAAEQREYMTSRRQKCITASCLTFILWGFFVTIWHFMGGN